MKLNKLLENNFPTCVDNIEISGVTFHDSRKIQSGDLFISPTGKHIQSAVDKGAAAILCDNFVGNVFNPNNISIIQSSLTATKIAEIAACFYDYPAKQMQIIGVTGTCGKTSCTQFIMQAFRHLSINCGVIGTEGAGVGDNLNYFGMTTPDSVTLQGILKNFVDNDICKAAVEVSSHGLHQGRVAGIEFAVGVFTNLSRDHLDYHKDFESYGNEKLKLFSQSEVSVINANDKFAQKFLPLAGKYIACGFTDAAINFLKQAPKISQVKAQNITPLEYGFAALIETPWGHGKLTIPLSGRFNIENALVVLSTLCVLGVSLEDAIDCIRILEPAAGRMQSFGGGGLPKVIVDYAHKPDALEKVLNTLRKECLGRIICVFGCGGNRDTGKRSLMGEIASSIADKVIITDDNPRDENPELIVADILAGVHSQTEVIVEHNRCKAITQAINEATSIDYVLIAGKGAEEVQIIQGQSIPFSDIDTVRIALKNL